MHLPPKQEPEEPEPQGLYYPVEYVLDTFDLWYRSGFQVYPNGMGYDDQDPQLLEDYFYLLRLVNWHMSRLDRRQTSSSSRPTMRFEDL